MKLSWKREMLGIAILAAMAAVAIYYYPALPARMPSHIDIHGRVNEWTGKNTFFLLVAASTFIYSFYLYKKLGGTGVPKGVN